MGNQNRTNTNRMNMGTRITVSLLIGPSLRQLRSTGTLEDSWYSESAANHSVLHTIPEVVSELFLPEPLPNTLDTAMKERGHNVNGVDGV